MLVYSSGVPGAPLRDVNVESSLSANPGRLVFQDNVKASSRLSYIPSLRQVLAIRFSLVTCAMTVLYLLVKELLEETMVPLNTLLFLTIIFTLLIMDLQFLARLEHSVKPLRIYENGIEMPTTWLERLLLKRRFVPWKDVETIFTVRHNLQEKGKLMYGVETEIVLVTKDKLTYSTFNKDRTEIRKAVGVISDLWGRYEEEKARIEDLERRGVGFSRVFVSIHPRSILFQSIALDVILFVPLGISILLDADMTIKAIMAATWVILTSIFGYIMIRIGRARTVLFTPWSNTQNDSSG